MFGGDVYSECYLHNVSDNFKTEANWLSAIICFCADLSTKTETKEKNTPALIVDCSIIHEQNT